jgi:hypothetical protein
MCRTLLLIAAGLKLRRGECIATWRSALKCCIGVYRYATLHIGEICVA